MESHEMTFFVSGHLDLTREEFAQHYEPVIRRAHAAGARFVVGDARGCDFMAQRLLHGLEAGQDRSTGRVRVFHMLERPRHSFGSGYGSNDPNLPKETWEGRRGGFPLVGGFTSDDDRDAAMTQASTHDIAWVRPGKDKRNSGTAKNLRRRELKRRHDRLAQRATWPEYRVDPGALGDGGTRFVEVVDMDEDASFAPNRVVRLPEEMVTRLRAAQDAVRAARELLESVEDEVRAECYAQETDGAQDA